MVTVPRKLIYAFSSLTQKERFSLPVSVESKTLLPFLLTFFIFISVDAQDSLSGKELRREQRHERRLELKQSHARTIIRATSLYATLTTTATFEIGRGILSAKIGLEENFGLNKEQFFFYGSAIHRLTPKSGIAVNYYGFTRSVTRVTDQDYIFLKDTIPAGSSVRAFFTTNVFSLGYMYTLVDDQKMFIAGYFNLYLMSVSTGVKSDGLRFDQQAGLTAPLPNFGVLGSFNLTPRWQIDGNLGYFGLNLPDFGGRLSNFSIHLIFRPWRWLGLSLGYEKFELRVSFEEEQVNTVVDYNFRGPAFGAKVSF